MDVGPDVLLGMYPPNAQLGFHWSLLRGDSIVVNWADQDLDAALITVRIWQLPRELYLPLIRK